MKKDDKTFKSCPPQNTGSTRALRFFELFRHAEKKSQFKSEKPVSVILSDSERSKKDSSLALRMTKKCAFTLAETLIVLTVLGVISAIVIPQVVIRYQESMNRMKIKKAMTVYDTAIAKMTFENDLKSQNALETWAKKENDTCDNAVEYFKTSDRENCTFRTSDGVWWDISDIMQPIVAVSENDLKTAQTDGTDGKKSFKFATSFDSMLGTFRVNDLIFEKKRLESELANTDEDKKAEIQEKVNELEKLFGMVNGVKSASSSCANDDILCKYNNGETLPECIDGEYKACASKYQLTWINEEDYPIGYNNEYIYKIYDKNGKAILEYYTSSVNNGSYEKIWNEDGSVVTSFYDKDSNNKTYKFYEKTISHNPNYSETTINWGLDSNNNTYKSKETIVNADRSSTTTAWGIDSNNNIFKNYEEIINKDKSSTKNEWRLDSNNNIFKSYEETINKDKTYNKTRWNIDSNNNIYKEREYTKDSYGTTSEDEWSLDSNNNVYKSWEQKSYKNGSFYYTEWRVDRNGNVYVYSSYSYGM